MSSAGVKSSGSLTNKSNSSITMSRSIENEGDKTRNHASRNIRRLFKKFLCNLFQKRKFLPKDTLHLKTCYNSRGLLPVNINVIWFR